MTTLTALFDANVLYPAPLRDLLMYLSLTDRVHGRWTDEIHDEWIRNVLKNRPDLSEAQLERTRCFMDEVGGEDALVTGYQALIPKLSLPDPNDRHVLAAAITAEADIIVTYNLRDFPKSALEPFNLEAQHPDRFVSLLFDLDISCVVSAVREQRAMLKKPPRSAEEMLATFEQQELPETVARLKKVINLI